MNPQLKRRACLGQQPLSQATVLAMLAGTPSFDFFAKMDLSTWEVFSFNPQTRTTCVLITNSTGERLISVPMPKVVPTSESATTSQNL